MPNAEFQHLQAELDQIRVQVISQLEAYHREIEAAIAGSSQGPASSPSGSDVQERMRKWESRQPELSQKLAVQTAEYQALRARAELDRYRQEMQVAELKKELALCDKETQRLHAALEGLMAEHARCANSGSGQDLRPQLEAVERERDRLRAELDGSLALKLARSIPWLLKPVRSLLMKQAPSPEDRS